ncbi:hypothetical protein HMPREF9396_2049 [Streptococcus sanguinis SK1059]|nr:hypothetical protein HMPREF9396_2049 [Streptococcus sanguinis SK1059]EGQ18888.1 hypothetical protein HMPREF8573_2030 [Streptococcus sanguinis ATCC 29667]EGQ25333.1 hypothetical protein HMPREF9387_0368 [Streptococcus sanguinis SK340]
MKSHPKTGQKHPLLSVFQMIACFETQIFKIRPFGFFVIKNKDLRQIENVVFYSLPKIKSKDRLNNAKSYVSTV